MREPFRYVASAFLNCIKGVCSFQRALKPFYILLQPSFKTAYKVYVRFPCLVNSLNGVINICLNEHTPYIQFKKAGATYKTVLAGVKEKERCLKLVRALIEHPVVGGPPLDFALARSAGLCRRVWPPHIGFRIRLKP